jgi:hypothetical protein
MVAWIELSEWEAGKWEVVAPCASAHTVSRVPFERDY